MLQIVKLKIDLNVRLGSETTVNYSRDYYEKPIATLSEKT